jgi:hypothetical protein
MSNPTNDMSVLNGQNLQRRRRPRPCCRIWLGNANQRFLALALQYLHVGRAASSANLKKNKFAQKGEASDS